MVTLVSYKCWFAICAGFYPKVIKWLMLNFATDLHFRKAFKAVFRHIAKRTHISDTPANLNLIKCRKFCKNDGLCKIFVFLFHISFHTSLHFDKGHIFCLSRLCAYVISVLRHTTFVDQTCHTVLFTARVCGWKIPFADETSVQALELFDKTNFFGKSDEAIHEWRSHDDAGADAWFFLLFPHQSIFAEALRTCIVEVNLKNNII